MTPLRGTVHANDVIIELGPPLVFAKKGVWSVVFFELLLERLGFLRLEGARAFLGYSLVSFCMQKRLLNEVASSYQLHVHYTLFHLKDKSLLGSLDLFLDTIELSGKTIKLPRMKRKAFKTIVVFSGKARY